MQKFYTFSELKEYLDENDYHWGECSMLEFGTVEALSVFRDCLEKRIISEQKYDITLRRILSSNEGKHFDVSLLGMPIRIHMDVEPTNLEEFKERGGEFFVDRLVKVYKYQYEGTGTKQSDS